MPPIYPVGAVKLWITLWVMLLVYYKFNIQEADRCVRPKSIRILTGRTHWVVLLISGLLPMWKNIY